MKEVQKIPSVIEIKDFCFQQPKSGRIKFMHAVDEIEAGVRP